MVNQSAKSGKLYLIPSDLGYAAPEQLFPPYNRDIIMHCRHFIVENIRSARRFIKSVEPSVNIDDLSFYELNKRTTQQQALEYILPLISGENMGMISEAGPPCIADPGSFIVKLCHENNITVEPLIGPSSILMALISSGFNGQNFSFHGYLPIDKKQRLNELKKLERQAKQSGQTQMFMETPYRNMQLLEQIVQHCDPSTMLCIAANISHPDAYIKSRPVKDWRGKLPSIHKKPAVFLLSS